SAAWCLGAVLAMAAAAATAASAAEPEAEAEVGLDEGPHYRVEMIVFRYGEGVAAGNEIFPPEDEGTHEPLERSPEEAQDDAMDSPLPDLDRRREAVWSDRPADAADMPRNLRRPGTEAAIVGEENGEANGDEARDGALS